MKQQDFALRVPMEPDLAYRARIAAAKLNLSRVEFIRQTMKAAIESIEQQPATTSQGGANGRK